MEDDLSGLDALFDANPDAARGIAAAYDVLLGGVPSVAGFAYLINNLIFTNYGSNNPAIHFNEENIFINITNALVQGNAEAAARFDALDGLGRTLGEQVTALYAALVPLAAQSAAGLAYLTRPEALQFYRDVAAERGVAGEDGAAIVALASLLKVLVHTDLGIGAAVNDFIVSVDNGSAELPASGALTPIEDAIGVPDTVAPTVAISAEAGQVAPGGSTVVTFDFSEKVTGFELADVTVTGGALSNLGQSTTDPTVYFATFTAGEQAGPASIQLVGAYQDLSGNLGASGGTTLAVGTGNAAPVATGESYSTAKNSVLTVAAATGVLANDSDANDDTLTAVLVTDVAHGALVLNADGSFTYTPAAGYAGPDSFSYKANDGTADGNTVTVSLTVTDSGTPAPDAINLDDIAGGTGGFRIVGEDGDNSAGRSVADAGDVNGDGFADLIIGAPQNSGADPYAGGAYVVYGSATRPASIDLDTIAAGIGGFRITGENTDDFAGSSVSSAGDINGDGFDDLIVGSYSNDAAGTNTGAAYVVFGSATSPASIDLATIAAGTGGFRMTGGNIDDLAGHSVSSAGDVNGDGIDDFLVGAPYDDDGSASNSGAAYIVFGTTTPPASVNLDDIGAGNGGFSITGQPNSALGFSVSSAGDVNGDGFDDIIVGAPDEGNTGKTYILFGSATPVSINVGFLTSNQGFQINAEALNDQLGVSVSSAGDFNGDGFDDLVVGAPRNDNGGSNAGAAYVVFGSAAPDSINLSAIPAGAGFKITGENAGDEAGISVSSAGDVNGDGFDDLIIGANGNDGNAGAAYVVFGSATPPASINLDTIAAGNGGFKITGENTDDGAGWSVSAAGDIDNDGYDDLIVGAPGNDEGGGGAGAAYVIYGGDWVV